MGNCEFESFINLFWVVSELVSISVLDKYERFLTCFKSLYSKIKLSGFFGFHVWGVQNLCLLSL